MNTKILIIRHAESEKNLKDIHGGKGECLSILGVKQANDLAKKLMKLGVNSRNSVITYPENVQTKETAEIIMKQLGVTDSNVSEFVPLNLGIINGLSNYEVEKKYPYIFELLFKWRNKEIEICDLNIPQMEPPFEFYNRGLNVLNDITFGKINIFIATNSLYILLINILFGNKCIKGGGYIHFDIPNCGISMFNVDVSRKVILDKEITDVHDVILYNENKLK